MASSGSGDLYLVGNFTPLQGGGDRAWVAAFDSSLVLKHEHRERGPATGDAYAAAVDERGNLFVGGRRITSSTPDIWLAEFDSSLTPISTADIDRAGAADSAVSLVMDGVSRVYVAGYTTVSSNQDAWLSRHAVTFHSKETVGSFRSFPSPFRPGAGG